MNKIFLIYNYNLESYILTKTFYNDSETEENLLLNCEVSFLPNAIKKAKQYRDNNIPNTIISCGNSIY